MTLRSVLTIAMTLAMTGCSADPEIAKNSFVYENFVGEGRPQYISTGSQVTLRKTPDSNAEIIDQVSVLKDHQFEFQTAITRSSQAGQIEVQREVLIQVREFGEIATLTADRYYDQSIHWTEKKITASDQPALLMWMAEGNCLIKIQQTINESDMCPTNSGDGWTLKTQPTIESWIEVTITNAKGWLKIDDQQIKEQSRNF